MADDPSPAADRLPTPLDHPPGAIPVQLSTDGDLSTVHYNVVDRTLTVPAILALTNAADTTIETRGQALLPAPGAAWPPGPTDELPTRSTFQLTTPAREASHVTLDAPGIYRLDAIDSASVPALVRAELAEPTTYEIAWRTNTTTLRFAGDVQEGETAHHQVQVPDAPIGHVEIQLEWDDSEDDLQGPGGDTWVRSRPDRLTVTASPGEDRTVERTGEARQGRVILRLPEATDRPANVTAPDPWTAYREAGGDAPLHPWLTGPLDLGVTLEDAGDTPRSPDQGPTEDQHSHYNLTVTIVRTDPHPIGPGSPPPGQAEARDRAAHDDHEHDHAGHTHHG